MFDLCAYALVALVAFLLGAAQRGIAFGFVQDAIVPTVLAGQLFERLPPVGFIAKQAAFILADQLLEHRAVVRRGGGKTDLANQLAANIHPDVTLIAKVVSYAFLG